MKINIKILNIAAIMCVACAAYADTGVWTNVSGGYWADTNNWQSGYVPVGTTNVADFAGLNSSETVMLTNYTEIGAVLFAGTEGDVWTLATDTNAVMGFAQVDQAGEIQVEGGRLNVMIPIKNADYGILKKGSGALYIAGTNDYTGITSLDGGTLILTNGTALRKSSVVFNSTNAVLKLQGDALIGGLTSAVEPTPDVALNGYELQIGGSQDQLEWSGRFTGTGTLAVVRGEVQTLTSEQSWKGVARVDNGILQLGRQQGQIVGWWRFDDAQDIGKDSGSLDNNLSRNGSPTQWQVQDAERGAVLNLDSGAYLKGQGAGLDLTGLPVNNDNFTIGFWMKPAADIPSTAVLFGWGTYYSDLKCNGMRLELSNSSTPMLYTNWANNRYVPSPVNLKDGNWHHVAIVYTGRHFYFGSSAESVGK